jgi:O-acetyl-ADP-ribose deacetylase (regulator of RNase III)
MLMKIEYRYDSIFQSDAQVIVNTVNCEGVMGKGLALEFKRRYPDMFKVYQQDCKTGKLHIGRPRLYKRENPPWILNFPTKDRWRYPSTLSYIEAGLQYFAAHYKEVGIESISFPKLGTENGGLSWEDVGPLMVRYLAQLDLHVSIYIHEHDIQFQIEHIPIHLRTRLEQATLPQTQLPLRNPEIDFGR